MLHSTVTPVQFYSVALFNCFISKIFFFHIKNYRFCVGDRFYLYDNKILCENDYADREMHSQMSHQQNNSINNSHSHSHNPHHQPNSSNSNVMNNNNNEYSINRNTNKGQTIDSSNNLMPLYSDKNSFTNFDVPIHVR